MSCVCDVVLFTTAYPVLGTFLTLLPQLPFYPLSLLLTLLPPYPLTLARSALCSLFFFDHFICVISRECKHMHVRISAPCFAGYRGCKIFFLIFAIMRLWCRTVYQRSPCFCCALPSYPLTLAQSALRGTGDLEYFCFSF